MSPVRVGDTVHDPARDRVGVVMARQGPYIQLRPLGGGREWDADPTRVRRLGPAELLSARVADVNTRSRAGLGDVPQITYRQSAEGESVTTRLSNQLSQGGGQGQGEGEGDGHPGQPWSPTDEPHPDGSTPPGDGDHRK
ncbi:hypothetical protein P3L51_32030 [Streptomyces sp. PSRA5]|uniref:hypothetical protein n=1 Tax=Streptomyces panacea TaxID=3035064 RepID=UPI00339CBE0B